MSSEKNRFLAKLRSIRTKKDTGQGIIEYALILAFVALAVVLVVNLLEPAIGNVFSDFVSEAPVAPPALANFTPPPTVTPDLPTATVPPGSTSTNTPTITPIPTDTATPTPTLTPTATPTDAPCLLGGPFTVARGTLNQIEAEDFRCGGIPDNAFFDDPTDISPGGSSIYRGDVGIEGPDLDNIPGSSPADYFIGFTRADEWVQYELDVQESRLWDFTINYKSNLDNRRFHIKVDGIDVTGIIDLPNSGGVWTDFEIPEIVLTQGLRTVEFYFENDDLDFNHFNIDVSIPVSPTPTNTPASNVMTFISNSGEDGWIQESNVGSDVGGNVNIGGNHIQIGDENNNREKVSILSFDTAAIPDAATITDVELRVRCNDISGDPYGLGSILVAVANNNGFSGDYALQSSDFEAATAVNNAATLSAVPGCNGAWANASFVAAGINAINLTGTTQLRLYFPGGSDTDGTRDRIRFNSGNNNTVTNRPELIITYIVP